jgi:hypothetical protein
LIKQVLSVTAKVAFECFLPMSERPYGTVKSGPESDMSFAQRVVDAERKT